MQPNWRATLLRRIGWSLGLASIWTWGLLGLRMVRDGLLPLEVWFGYSLSFFMTAVYVYFGLLIYATVRAESRRRVAASPRRSRWAAFAARSRRPVLLVGIAGLAAAVVSLAGWLLLRYPGPQAISGTYASIVLALMVLGVAAVGTLIARGAE
jgi:heme A synthase